MPIQLLQQDITALACDVLVNPTDEQFSGSGGVDAAVHGAAGRRLRMACHRLAPLSVGEVCSTKGYGLKSKYVIHTVGPRWQGGDQNEAALLRSCYANALALSEQLGAESVAFPLISSGAFGFPKDQVLRVALDAVSEYLLTAQEEPDVILCVPDRRAYSLAEEDGLKTFLGEAPCPMPVGNAAPRSALTDKRPAPAPRARRAAPKAAGFQPGRRFESRCEEPFREETAGEDAAGTHADESNAASLSFEAEELPLPAAEPCFDRALPCAAKPEESLEDWLKQQDDTFAVTLLKLIDKKGLTDVECYKRANVSRKTFSKINTQKNYRPSKQTVLAFAVGLQLTLEETETLLRTAGFSLSRCYVADKIVEYFIRSGNYDIFEINAALYQYDQVLLGC